MKKVLGVVGRALCLLFLLLMILLLFAQNWLFTTWSELTADEVIFHLKASLGGTNPEMITELILKYLLPGALVFLAFVILAIVLKKKKECIFKKIWGLYFILAICLCVIFCVRLERHTGLLSTGYHWVELKLNPGADFIAQEYADPKEVKLTFPEKKRNLIYVFLESAEMTFADKEKGGGFEQSCIPELEQISLENENFGTPGQLNGGYSLSGSNWTMGAMFAHSSGLPLQIPLTGNAMTGQDSFFPDIVTLGDILKEQGYHQRLLIGSDASFGGRDLYYSTHGDFEIHDYVWAIQNGKIPEDYKVWWGYEDEKLFAFAKEELTELAGQEEPFCLTMLTVDTHFSDGYVCDLCEDTFGENQYANVYACSSKQTAEFLDWIKTQDFYENTTVVLVGDHPTMDADFCDDVDKDYERRVYTAFINSAAQRKDDGARLYSTMDLFPTTLAAMGVTIKGDKLGLGTNLFSGKKTMIEEYGLERADEKMSLPSLFMQEKSNVRITEEDLYNTRVALSLVPKKKKNKLRLRSSGIRTLNYTSCHKAVLEVTPKGGGEVYTYEMKVKPSKNDPNVFRLDVTTDIDFDLAGLFEYRVYVDVEGGFEHYELYDSTKVPVPEEETAE